MSKQYIDIVKNIIENPSGLNELNLEELELLLDYLGREGK